MTNLFDDEAGHVHFGYGHGQGAGTKNDGQSEPAPRSMRSPPAQPPGGEAIKVHLPLLLAVCLMSTGTTLPEIVPIPEPRPGTALPTETTKPDDSGTQAKSKPADDKPPEDEKTDEEDEVYVPPPIETEDPRLFAACTAELKAMGAEFREVERIDDGDGCGIDRPIELKTVAPGIALSPSGTLRCQAAVNLARWTRDVVNPMLKKSQPTETLAAVNQASAYVCRKRNGASTGKISEHARGNAIDVAGFTFKSGKTFTIAPREEESTLNGAFQRAITSAACLYFSTVLDPGSDKAHETHLHLDTLKRKGGYRYCW